MTDRPANPRSYWSQLDAAEAALGGADYAAAETLYHEAVSLRESSPGRVFLTEKLGDRLQRMLKRREGEGDRDLELGRWRLRTDGFTNRFLAQGEHVVREALRLTELRPEDEAETNQPVLERALYLVSRSRLFPPEPRSAIPLLKGLVRTACRTGRPFDVQMVRHDLPLTEEERLWLAAKGGDMLESFVELGHLEPGSPLAGEWARSILQILRQQYFGSVGRLEEERSWLEAVTADRLLDKPTACVALFRQYLAISPLPGPRSDEARVRILEILANTPRIHLGVPRYGEALAALQAAGLASGSALVDRYQRALACIEHRRPRGRDQAWATVACEPDGSLAVVFWWDRQPRDLAFWRPGEDPEAIDAFLAPCGDRILAADAEVEAVVGQRWACGVGGWSAGQYAEALLEPRIPAAGLDPETRLRWAMAEAGPWRAGWSPQAGHPWLAAPPNTSTADLWRGRKAGAAILAGLDLLAIRSRLAEGDPSLRAGIGALARRGDRAAAELYALVTLNQDADLALDSSFEPWTLPLLWTRPDPLGPDPESEAGAAGQGALDGLRPDLGRNDLAIVSSGSPGAVMAAWGDSRSKWRVVLDRPGRRQALSRIAHGVLGPVTMVPRGRTVHALGPALDALDGLLARPSAVAPDAGGLLALFHWQRLVESHNGDLLDFVEIRPRKSCNIDIYEIYQAFVASLPTEPLGTSGADPDSWAGQYAQRARKSGLITGAASDLTPVAAELDAAWGVFEGSDASWVFLDGAAVHAFLLERGDRPLADLHEILHSRGRRHLSVLTGAVWLRAAAEDLLQEVLAVYGRAYRLALTDLNPPLLRLADQGLRPDALDHQGAALAFQLQWLESLEPASPVTIAVPAEGSLRMFWQAVASGGFGPAAAQAGFLDLPGPGGLPGEGRDLGVLVLPAVPGLDPEAWARPIDPTAASWASADTERSGILDRQIRRSALAVASLMAGDWTEVVVLDVRWWHMLRGHHSGPQPGPEPQEPAVWSAQLALTAAGASGARLFPLPGQGEGRLDRAQAARMAEVRRWVAAQGIGGAGPMAEPKHESKALGPAAVAQAAGGRPPVTLHLGTVQQAWSAHAAQVAGDRDRGRLESWLLVVAESVAPPWRALVDHDIHPGPSVWVPGCPAGPRVSVMWVTPEAFLHKEFLEDAAARPPVAVLATGVDAWLPESGDERHQAAVALRIMLDRIPAPITLQAAGLAAPWAAFFQDVLGPRLRLEGPAPAEAVPAAAEADAGPAAAAAPGDLAAPWDPVASALGRPLARAHRLRRFLGRLRPTLAHDRGSTDPSLPLASPNELVSVAWLGRLAGLGAEDMVRGIRVLRWAVRVSGQPLAAAAVGAEQGPAGAAGVSSPPGRTAGHALLIPFRFAELENVLSRTQEQLGVLLPLWLGGLAPGMNTWIDLDNPPARIPGDDLLRIDALLGAWAGGERPLGGLVYRCRRGTLNSNRRLLGCAGDPRAMLQGLREEIRTFLSRIRDVMDAAVETPTGFLVETGLLDLRPQEKEFLALGSALGFWRWLGPACGGAYHLVDVMALADSPAVLPDHPAWKLWEALLTAGSRASGFSPAEDGDLRPAAGSGRWGGLRTLLGPGSGPGDDLAEPIARIAALASDPKPAQLVLKGMAGTGRHQALIRGILAARASAPDPAELTVFCPDPATASFLASEYLAEGGRGALEVIIPDRATPLASQPGTGRADPAGSLVVMCEVQRFPAELRYKVAQLGRGRRLITTVDPAATEESWEHLFLTSPRPEHILEFRQQRRLSRRLWHEVRQLHGQGARAASGTRSPVRGGVTAEYAANLDQCVGLLAAQAVGVVPAPVLRLTASVPADLEYLGSALRDRGWLAEAEGRLDPLLTPGPREMLAALTDLLAVAGDFGPLPGEGRDDQRAEKAPGSAGPRLLLPLLVGPACADPWLSWCEQNTALCREASLGEAVGVLATTPWLQEQLAHGSARSRLSFLLEPWGGQDLPALTRDGLWAVWQTILNLRLGPAGSVPARPVALLSPADRLPGAWAPAGIQLCLGSEPARFHYGIWSRIEKDLLILYQERSPLPGASPR